MFLIQKSSFGDLSADGGFRKLSGNGLFHKNTSNQRKEKSESISYPYRCIFFIYCGANFEL